MMGFRGWARMELWRCYQEGDYSLLILDREVLEIQGLTISGKVRMGIEGSAGVFIAWIDRSFVLLTDAFVNNVRSSLKFDYLQMLFLGSFLINIERNFRLFLFRLTLRATQLWNFFATQLWFLKCCLWSGLLVQLGRVVYRFTSV